MTWFIFPCFPSYETFLFRANDPLAFSPPPRLIFSSFLPKDLAPFPMRLRSFPWSLLGSFQPHVNRTLAYSRTSAYRLNFAFFNDLTDDTNLLFCLISSSGLSRNISSRIIRQIARIIAPGFSYIYSHHSRLPTPFLLLYPPI